MANSRGPAGTFGGLRVLSLESRRAPEIARLIETFGGIAVGAPAMREVPREANASAIQFARTLAAGEYDAVIFLTGVGTRALERAIESVCSREQFAGALRRVAVVARGPKPAAVLKELGVPIAFTAPQPNTWRELLRALDEHRLSLPLAGCRVAVQEYGVPNPDLLAGLAARGAKVCRVPVYEWALPEDTGPLRAAVHNVIRGEIDVVLFTTSIQATHLLEFAGQMGLAQEVRRALNAVVICSIGPTTTEGLVSLGLSPDWEASQPRMGILVAEAAERSAALLDRKRQHGVPAAGPAAAP